MINYITGYEWRLNKKPKRYLGFALLHVYSFLGKRKAPSFVIDLVGKWVPIIDQEKFRAAMDEVMTGYANAVTEQMNQSSELVRIFDAKETV